MKLGASLLFLGFALVACRKASVRGDLPADETAAGNTAEILPVPSPGS